MAEQEEQEEGIEDDETESVMCSVCGGTPCDWTVYGEGILSETGLMYEEDPHKGEGVVDNNHRRKSAYRYYIYENTAFCENGTGLEFLHVSLTV